MIYLDHHAATPLCSAAAAAMQRANPTSWANPASVHGAGRAAGALPDEARQTFLLREVDGLSYSEIAKSLGVPKGTVMSRLHHARRRVRALLVEQGVGEPGEEPL